MQIPLSQSRLHWVEARGESNTTQQSGETKSFPRHSSKTASINECLQLVDA